MHARENALKEWLIYTLKHQDFQLVPLAGDASFRRYFRLHHDGLTYVVMDAPPDKEDLEPFIHIAQTLKKTGILTPEILAIDLEQGFLLLSDLGDELLLNDLRLETANKYYHQAMETLIKIQSCSIYDSSLLPFDKPHMLKEMNLCIEWFFKSYLALELNQEELTLIQKTMDWIATEVTQQPLTFIHRDYHSRNLMLIKEHTEIKLGVIDFQDAMCGPLTYDLVSLLKDCYISWPRKQILEWVRYFYTHQSAAANHYSLSEFTRAFDLCGLQRHLKVLGIFCRLYLRDNKPGYLKDLPLTLKYVLECTEIYEELHPFFHFLQMRVNLP
ncbi:aminoglycoside phosphotransferase family protein [Legionella longbeachae]|uniref:Aminoglycoside phosphotransferase domain-containing protein n=1 Tax=Legionella longbeachae serogroup 1 (strain NSW150) TaxID=661367 RepID=D3HPI3_LEGLN|nr:phosphotransferase [Legionella longbeachae]VEE01322.1 putative phosphotransferase [Legionella oakridgensis]HBD7398242.1 phosphotransferase [Legionella pneumophila]ARB92313.1 phosphotransferase [Legionella longbeachae]ARM34506.1 phosphotransferase [Legionella longbeachae]EEZ96198.1 putative aminoglycoside phosphotransferase [Legionella longbeachae D-4968]